MRLLIAEDEAALAETLRRGLGQAGFAVDVVHDGAEALWRASSTAYDVIVLDIMLPRMHGYEVLRTLRERAVWTPIIMLTAKDGEYDQTDAFDLGADDYLTKPFSFLVLVARLRALIRRGSPERPTVLTAGDLTLDPGRRRVERAGTEILLTRREFGVLEYLMHHRDEVVAKTTILENVWDVAFEGDVNVVEVYIRYLRKKIDEPFGRQSIETVRGMGYRISREDPPAAS
jgi:DNA-binding response OmpR family regulator